MFWTQSTAVTEYSSIYQLLDTGPDLLNTEQFKVPSRYEDAPHVCHLVHISSTIRNKWGRIIRPQMEQTSSKVWINLRCTVLWRWPTENPFTQPTRSGSLFSRRNIALILFSGCKKLSFIFQCKKTLIFTVFCFQNPGFFEFSDNDTKVSGIYGDAWSVLADSLNFTYALELLN